MDTNKHAELIEKCEKAIKDVIHEATEDYIKGESRTAWSFITDSDFDGAYMALKDSGSSSIDLARVLKENMWRDLGTAMSSYSTEFYTLEQIAILMAQAIQTWENA